MNSVKRNIFKEIIKKERY